MMNRFTLYCTRKGVFIYVHGPRRAQGIDGAI